MYQNDRELAVVAVCPGPAQATEQTKTPVESSSDVPQAPDPMISQAELRTYVEQAEVCRAHQRLRQSLIERLESGALVEPGELKAEIEPDYVRRWSSRQLTELLGSEKTSELWHRLQPARYRWLLIFREPGRDVAWKAYRLANPPLETIAPQSSRKEIE
jgi:hypothetical protein